MSNKQHAVNAASIDSAEAPGVNPFRLSLKKRWLAKMIERVSGLAPLAKYYDKRPSGLGLNEVERGKEFLDYTLSVLGADVKPMNPHQLQQIPAQGPLLVVCNHPLGGLEGVALTRTLLQVRQDVKVLTNKFLTLIPELNPLFIGVDVLSANAARENARGIRSACKHLENGGVLLMFPAGMVSAININGLNPARWNVADRPWNTLVGRMARKFNAPCLPMFVHGRNSKLFYLLGLIHPRLRTYMLARELSNKPGQIFDVQIGDMISEQELIRLEDDRAITNYLRIATDVLGNNGSPSEAQVNDRIDQHLEPIEVEQGQRERILKELEQLDDCLLAEQNNFYVYCAPYPRLGSIMTAIAQARELTFRAAGEGTGKSLDSDRFDPHYDHLFIWDREQHKIVGGYRLGRADEIVTKHGLHALYSRSLYHFNEEYLARLGGALEVGRSFVAPEYQRHPRALDLLWQGIGAYVVRHPKYHTLFGCVSISKEHSELARAFLSDSMLESFRAEQKFLGDVRPVAPLKVRGKLWTAEILSSITDIAVINKLLGRFDAGKTVPILLRQYLNLNGRFVCFSLNKGFNNSLDGLILVDLRKTSERYLRRYLGRAGSAKFLQRWSVINNEFDTALSSQKEGRNKKTKEKHETAA